MCAAVLYSVSGLFYLFSFIQKKESLIRTGVIIARLGFISHTVCLSLYWSRPDYLAFSTFQVINDAAWSGILIFLLVLFIYNFLKPTGILVVPFTMLTMVWAAVSKKDIGPTPPAFDTPWFFIHIIGSALAYGLVLVAGAIGIIYLLKTRYAGEAFYDSMADLKVLDDLNYYFIGFGFIMLTMMIISGMFYSHQLHGSYWGWDPLEVQSLISWIVYAIWLHLRLTLGWRGKKLAWYAIVALPVMVIAIWGIPFVPDMFHTGFRVEHPSMGVTQ